jgi:hypothetical protein
MDSLTSLKNQLSANGHRIIRFVGYELETDHGIFTLYDEEVYLNKELLPTVKVKEIINGKPQARQSKEPTSRVSDVQTAQGERRKAGTTRKGRTGKAQRPAQVD